MLRTTLMAASPKNYYALFSPFSTTGTIREFIAGIERFARSTAGSDHDLYLKYKGDALEVFAEIFFRAHANDSAVGLTDYTPVPLTEDYGVDAIGRNPNGHRAAVQVKFRGNPEDSVTYAELARTFTSGLIKHQLDLMQSSTVYVFTTAHEVTPQAKHVLGNRIVLINLEVIKIKVDNNQNFWPFALREVEETLSAPFVT